MNTCATIRKIVKLHFSNGYSYGLIAHRLGMTRCQVAGIIARNRPADAIAPRKPAGTDVSNKTMRALA